ncbi:MAG: T9SS type A sorting domain-containing protein [Bacteroidia bacterium]
MLKRVSFCILLFLFAGYLQVSAQTPDWSTVIAPIIYKNCSSCHHNGGIGPFPLMSYSHAVMASWNIKIKVTNKEMPPWPADPTYRHFAYEALLDSSEIAAISDWVDNGMPLGDTTLAPAPPVFSQTGSLLDTINMTLQIPPYTLQYNTDEYRYFAMHSGFTDTVYVSKIEVIPGLSQAVHHADIHYDLTGQSFYNDSVTPLPGFSGGVVSSYYMNAWMGGGNIVEYPPNWGILVPPGADFVFEIHYGPGHVGQTDTTKMNLRFITNGSVVRPIHVGWLLNNPIPSQGPLVLPPNVITSFNQMSAPMPIDRSLISVCPHMHLLGKSYRVWYISLTGDSVPLVNIPQWKFHWQKYYMFQHVQKIPAGARIYSEASYDNTVNNPFNPNNPPITVYNGPTTEDEMLMTYFIWANYMPGDENILLDTTLLTSVPNNFVSAQQETFQLYPNPAHDYFFLDAVFSENIAAELRLVNAFGQLLEKRNVKGNQIHEQLDVTGYPDGIYFAVLVTPEGLLTKKFIRLSDK